MVVVVTTAICSWSRSVKYKQRRTRLLDGWPSRYETAAGDSVRLRGVDFKLFMWPSGVENAMSSTHWLGLGAPLLRPSCNLG